MRVKFLRANTTFRGDFSRGDEADVSERRARIWAEAGVVEILDVREPTSAAPARKVAPAPATGGKKG